MIRFSRNIKRTQSVALAFIIMFWQLSFAAIPFLASQSASALETSFLSPSATHTPNNWDVNTVANVQSSNNVYASDNDGSEQGYANFSFPAIPAGATINGISVQIEAKSSDSSGCRVGAKLSGNNGTSYTAYKYADVTGTDDLKTFGGASDLWGSTWSYTSFTDANFVLAVEDNDPGGGCDNSAITSVDLIQAKVHYTEGVVVVPDYQCTDDTAGANDEPGQKDLTQLCKDQNAPSGEENVTWNWDDLGTSGGGQSLDACGLFDSDGDGNANYSMCVTTAGDPAEFDTLTIYSCSDAKNDRCTNPDTITGPYDTQCTVDQLGTDPFLTGDFNPQDTVASCNFILADLNAGNVDLNLTDVCSYPSKQPNSDPSDCVIIQTNPVALIEVFKNVVPNGNGGLFNLTVDGPAADDTTTVNDVGDGGTTGQVVVSPPTGGGTATVSETAGSNTSLDYFTSSINCVNRGNGQVVATGSGTSLQVPISDSSDIVCTITNTLRQGTVTVNKITDPANDPALFSITASGTGAIEGNATRTLSTAANVTYTVDYGTYAVDEADAAGWQESANTCVNVVVGPNTPNPTCTITNTKLATIQIVKDALPNNAQDFSFLTSTLPGGNFLLDDDSGATNADSVLNSQKTFTDLAPNVAYSVSEDTLPGWQRTGLSCDTGNYNIVGSMVSITPTAGQTIVCTYTNTKLGSISGVKFEVDAGSTSGVGGTPLSNWTIFIDSNNDGLLDPGELFDITDVNGSYSFLDLLPGTYDLDEVNQVGWTQIFGPSAVELDAGEVSTGNDFGNFQNASINGFKWNDINGNGTYDNEAKLDGWTITLFNDSNDQDTDLNNQVAQTVTAGGGNYSFTNLVPGTYAVCESPQAGWVQTFPGVPACHIIVINESGETNQADFGNQGRGTIQVIKNVDHDGDGQVDETNATDWTWDIDGSGNFATGSTQGVAAGSYTVSEDQKAGYHVTSVNCNGETQGTLVSEQITINVAPAETVVCTFVNTRDTGTITVDKVLLPNADPGKFNLQINGTTAGTGANVGHGGTTGAVSVVTGQYTIGETAGTSTSLSDYSTQYVCLSGRTVVASGSTTTSTTFVVGSEDNITCTITNTRFAKVIVTKYNDYNRNGQKDQDEPTLPDWDFTLSGSNPCADDLINEFTSLRSIEQLIICDASLNSATETTGADGTATFENVLPLRSYELSETLKEDWKLSDIDCTGGEQPQLELLVAPTDKALIYPAPGGEVRCEFGNYQEPLLNITKDNNRPNPTTVGDTVTYTLIIDVPSNSGAVFNTIVQDLPPENFEYVPGSWTANSNLRGDLKAAGITPEPTYASPGQWLLGRMLPGEIVTLTYKATIASSVITGTYPDIAFAFGCATPAACSSTSANAVLANISTGDDSPFVGTEVTILSPAVVAKNTVRLVDTGASEIWRSMIVAGFIILVTLATFVVSRPQKGGRS